MKKFRELKEEVATPSIAVRSLYTKMYAKHGGTASKAKDAQSKAYSEVEKKHGKEMRDSLEAFHKKNMNEAVKDKFDIGEYDQEGDMAKSDLRSILANAKRLHDMLEDSDNLPEWVQAKITKAEDYMSTVANYMEAEMNEEVELDEENKPTNPELWARAKAMAKSKFDVYPCVPLNSLAIKRDGAVRHDQLQIGDEILTYNMNLDKMEWKPVLHKHYYENAPLLEIGKPSPSPFYFRCTPNHKWVISNEDEIELVETKDLTAHMQLLLNSFSLEDHDNLIKKWSIEDKFQEQLSNVPEENKKEFTTSYYKNLAQRILDLSVDERKLLFPSYMKYHSSENIYMIESNAEDVWCPTTENETWVMLQNGIVTITGNSAYANGWAAKWYKSKGGSWKSVNEENYEVTVMHTTKDGEKGEHTHKVMNADDARHAKNIALQKHEKMLNNRGVEVRGMGTTTAKVMEETEVVEEGSAYDRINARFKKLSGKSLEDTAKYHKAESEKLAKEIKDQEEKNKKMKSEAVKTDDLPFTPDKPKKKDIIAGKYGAGYSTAKSLAKQAMKKQMEKMKKPIKEEMSKKAKIVKNIMKNKNSDKFESEPIISKTVDDKES
jgi:hypothetical protein